MAQLIGHEAKARALGSLSLLEQVAHHKSVFFKATWANYEDAKLGSPRLMPNADLTSALRWDYSGMREMIIGDAPGFDDILGAYAALNELKAQGLAAGIGVGAKNWTSIAEIDAQVELDWVMFANSYTLYSHPADLLAFMDSLHAKGVAIINSAVFNAGFLTGGEFFNYVKLDPANPDHAEKFAWREKFFALCEQQSQMPSEVCIQFGKSHPGIVALALSTSRPHRVKTNVEAMSVEVPKTFWDLLKEEGLLAADHPYISH